MIVLMIQIALWDDRVVVVWGEHTLERHREINPSEAAHLRVAGLIARIALWSIAALVMLDLWNSISPRWHEEHVFARLAAGRPLHGALRRMGIGGKCVFNVLPGAGMDKGTAINCLMENSGACSVGYVGDDTTDEDVFRLRRKGLLTVRVGPGSSNAEFFLHHRLGMVQLLDELISRLRRRSHLVMER